MMGYGRRYAVNAYEKLGLTPQADQQQVHDAYRKLVKEYHPDRFEQGSEQQQSAQQKMIELNLAYEEAMSLSAKAPPSRLHISPEAVESLAERMYEQGSYESALMQLTRSTRKDARWFNLQGKILLGLKQYSSAHQSFREAVRMDPDNREYREGALKAAVAMKKNRHLIYRMRDWVDGIVHPRRL